VQVLYIDCVYKDSGLHTLVRDVYTRVREIQVYWRGLAKEDTYSIEQSPSWEANRFSASQEILSILQNPKIHYRSYKCTPPVPIQMFPSYKFILLVGGLWNSNRDLGSV